jgi:ABC-type glycerol-3-phosphate transport system permease component
VLGVTLWALTRDVDRDLAMLGLGCRVLEAVQGDGAIYFAVSGVVFCWLLLKGRMIPAAVSWIGLGGSLLVIVVTLLQRLTAGTANNWASSLTWMTWLPMLIFELAFAVLLLTNAVRLAPSRT